MTVNQNEFRIVGMSRSGNHAIINWILSQLNARYCFLNCVEGKSNPYRSARCTAQGLPYRTNIPDFDYAAEQRGDFAAKDYFLYNYEDSFLAHAASPWFEEHHDRLVGESRRRLDILILRDPFNLFASRLWLPTPQVSPGIAMKIWKQHAREYLRTDKAKLSRPFVGILYNQWVTDKTYRRAIAARLRIPFSDSGINAVDQCAGGSSFDGMRFDGQAQKMRVLDRWRNCIDHEDYLRLFDKDALALSNAVFGPLAAAQKIAYTRLLYSGEVSLAP